MLPCSVTFPAGPLGARRSRSRLAAVERRDSDRGHRASRRPREHAYDGKGLSQGVAPVLRRGAKAMEDIFKAHQTATEPPILPPASSETTTERRNSPDAI